MVFAVFYSFFPSLNPTTKKEYSTLEGKKKSLTTWLGLQEVRRTDSRKTRDEPRGIQYQERRMPQDTTEVKSTVITHPTFLLVNRHSREQAAAIYTYLWNR